MNSGVLFVTEDHSRKNTGITAVVNFLSAICQTSASDQSAIIIVAVGAGSIAPADGIELIEVPADLCGFNWGWSAKFKKVIKQSIKNHKIGVLHLHGLWKAAPWVAQKVAHSLGVSTILSVHGMVEPWAWYGQGKLRTLKKNLYWHLLAKPVFSRVSVLHAITPLEQRHLSDLLPDKRIELIPNAIDLSEIDSQLSFSDRVLQKRILYVGRIHPKKGVDLLISAFISANLGSQWRLLIAGPEEDQNYLQLLKADAKKSELCDQIEFSGPIYEVEKYTCMMNSWVVVAPSYSEVVGMVNLESAGCYTPTLTSPQTGLLNWEEGGGILVEPDRRLLSDALKTVAQWSVPERIQRGTRSRKFVEQLYSLTSVRAKWMSLYEELAKMTKLPE